jgi:antitoxin (DNA-binding transcriptional repressor) of toxin-antitoxin stability system
MAVIRQVQKTGKPVSITNHGKPPAKMIPAANGIFGYMPGKVKIAGDITRGCSGGKLGEQVIPLGTYECTDL